jgi:hypothetical protein
MVFYTLSHQTYRVAPSLESFRTGRGSDGYNIDDDSYYLPDNTIRFRFTFELSSSIKKEYIKLFFLNRLFHTDIAIEDLDPIKLLKFITKNSGDSKSFLEGGDNSIEGSCLIYCRYGEIVKYQLPHNSRLVKLFKHDDEIFSIDIYELADNIFLSNRKRIFLEKKQILDEIIEHENRVRLNPIQIILRDHYLYNLEGSLFDKYVGPVISPHSNMYLRTLSNERYRVAPSLLSFRTGRGINKYRTDYDSYYLEDKTIRFIFSSDLDASLKYKYSELLCLMRISKLFHTDIAKEDIDPIELLKFITEYCDIDGIDASFLEGGDNSIEGSCMIYCRFGKIVKYQLPHNSSLVKLFEENGKIFSIDIYELADNIFLSDKKTIFLEKKQIINKIIEPMHRMCRTSAIKIILRNHYLYNLNGELFDTYVGPVMSPPLKKVRKMGGSKIKKVTRKVYLDNKGKSYIKYDNIMIYLKK